MLLADNSNCLKDVGAFQTNPKWEHMILRQSEIYHRENDIRSDFYRDYTRILHSTAYRRLKHKTQVFFAPQNDHICTRIEHVTHVESISYTIAKFLGLNVELAQSISIGHDLGHAPFGHMGESIICSISESKLGMKFWHEKNGLHFVDDIELLEDDHRIKQNLDLTYAVRDGIISHCGELDENGLAPRNEAIDLNDINEPGKPAPYTWEGCVVKIADKIAYLARDIEDAYMLNLLDELQFPALRNLTKIARKNKKDGTIKAKDLSEINNTILIHDFIMDICKNSNIRNGIRLSDEKFEVMNEIRAFNNEYIYHHKRIEAYREYACLVINKIYAILESCYDGETTLKNLEDMQKYYQLLASGFIEWICMLWDLPCTNRRNGNLRNKIIYRVSQNKLEYLKAIVDYISGMTDQYAIRVFNEIITF